MSTPNRLSQPATKDRTAEIAARREHIVIRGEVWFKMRGSIKQSFSKRWLSEGL